MARTDYKARERSRSNRGRRGGSGFFWFVTGAVLGAFGVGLAWTLQDRAPTPDQSQSRAQVQAQPRNEPSFVYPQLLPEMEVLVPDEELGASAPPPRKPVTKPEQEKSATPERSGSEKVAAAEKAPSTTKGGSYLVQVASFRRASDADRLKAKLALLGIHAQIQRVTVNGKAYHRVRAGPYKGKQEVNKTRALLSRKGFDSIAVKLR